MTRPTAGARGAGDIALREWAGEPVEHWRAAWGVPRLVVYRRTGSTNDRARRLAEEGAPAGTVVLADEQTAGRGRAGRRWYAPAGKALLLSIILRLERVEDQEAALGLLPVLVGLATARAVERVAGLSAGLKWPNDVVLEGMGKLAGVLCEGAVTAAGGACIVAGVGVNVHQQMEDWPAQIRAHATSILLATGRDVARARLAGVLVAEILELAGHVAGRLEEGVLHEIATRDLLRGRRVSVDGHARGIARGIAADGSLRLEDDDGRETLVRTGTVRVLDATERPRVRSKREARR